MRINRFLLLLLVFPLFAGAQPELPAKRGGGAGDGDLEMEHKTSSQPKTVIPSRLRSWVLSGPLMTETPVEHDTSTLNFHIYNPIYKKSISNSYLGYTGSPYRSNLFFDREEATAFYFLRSFSSFYLNQDAVRYYNTTTPYSSLKYIQGNQYEQLFTAFYTQNIDSLTNFGFRYNALKNKGPYNYQEALHEDLNLFFSRNTERYSGYFSFVTGTNRVNENGGIVDSLVNMRRESGQISVRLSNPIETSIKNISVFTSHEYRLGSFSPVLSGDSLVGRVFKPAFSVRYSVEYSHFNRQFIEKSVDQQFFDTTYFNIGNRIDSALFGRLVQRVQLNALENPDRKFTFGKMVFLENEIVEASHPVRYGLSKYNYANLYLGGSLYRHEGRFWNWEALARIAVLGRNLGDALVKGSMGKPLRVFQDTILLFAEGWYQDQKADIFLEHWHDNHFKWENTFKKQHEIVLRGNIDYPRFHLRGGMNYALISNYLYMDEQALPAQYDREFLVYSIWLDKDFVLGPFCWSNKAVLQQVSDPAVLHLPLFSAYSSVSFSGVLFKVMKYQLGAEIYYHTPFLAESYQPSTTTFYLQNERMAGGFPWVNVFLNAKLKRTSAFVTYQHANSWISNGNFFGTTNYPLDRAALRFGFYWTFYD